MIQPALDDPPVAYADYLNFPDDERWEIIRGEAYAGRAAPNTLHQRVASELLTTYLEKLMQKEGLRIRAAIALTILLCLLPQASVGEEIGHVDTNFKWLGPDDKIVVEAFDDPQVPGVTCYLSRAKTGGISGAVGIAEDTSDASIACRQTGPISLSKEIKAGKRDGEQVFKKRTSLVFKTMQVVRFYDARRNTLVYLVYSDRVVEGSPKNSVTAVPIMPSPELRPHLSR